MTAYPYQSSQPFKRRRNRTEEQREATKRQRLATIAERYGTFMGGHTTPQIRMIISPWFADEHGIMTRTIWAAE